MGKEYLPIMVMLTHSNTYEHKEEIKKYGGEWCSDSLRWWVPKDNLHLVEKILKPSPEKNVVNTAKPVEPKKKRGRPKKEKPNG